METTITGLAAIEMAEREGLTLGKYADPVEGAREGLTPDEAREIAREDPGLVYLVAEVSREQIETLRDEAGEAGDEAQVALCERALDGDRDAWARCVRAILAARAMESA